MADSVAWRPCDLAYRWLRPVLPLCPSPVSRDGFPRIGLCRRRNGAIPGNLRSLRRALFSPDVIPPPKMALINARSLVNKTFLLNYFFSSHSLDFMFITESWTKVGDLTPFSELVPSDCTFFNFPRPNRRGGGLVTILKSSFLVRCRCQVSWHFILPVRFSYRGLLRMCSSIFRTFSHAEQQYLMHLHYCKG